MIRTETSGSTGHSSNYNYIYFKAIELRVCRTLHVHSLLYYFRDDDSISCAPN